MATPWVVGYTKMSKPVTLHLLRQYDFTHEEEESCLVRGMEMTLDSVVQRPGVNQAIGIQFWEDVRLYGLEEAMIYLRQYLPDTDLSQLQGEVDEAIKLVRG